MRYQSERMRRAEQDTGYIPPTSSAIATALMLERFAYILEQQQAEDPRKRPPRRRYS
jgi:hypothetical protein